jgi:isoleucyl-tRNA synthetase
VMDEHGHKMSKSLGNTIAPQDVIAQSGADVLRLWVSMVDYREDIRVGKEILARVVEAYRKFRNVIRILLANLYDFDPRTELVPASRMLEIDRWVMARYAASAARIVRAYDEYDYPGAYQTANTFMTLDLSAFYVDVTKDRMYTLGAASAARRSGQTAMFLIVDGLARLLAPILPFTMDELWRNLPGAREPSVHLAGFPGKLSDWDDPALLERWSLLRDVRNVVNDELERKRADKVIRGSLEARVMVHADGHVLDVLQQHADDLPTIFGVSEAAVVARSGQGERGSTRVEVEKATGVKCERCWRYVPGVSATGDFKGICDRCVDALAEPVSR